MNNSLREEYFNWMYEKVTKGYTDGLSYRQLFEKLHSIEFVAVLPLDENRASDGKDLRRHFLYDNGYFLLGSNLVDDLGEEPCSMLEMMVALALRCEEQIMLNPDKGDRVGEWFWIMCDTSGLDAFHDGQFDEEQLEHIVDYIMYRQYKEDGTGGLFKVPDHRRDLRDVELWYQLCWYLDEYYINE